MYATLTTELACYFSFCRWSDAQTLPRITSKKSLIYPTPKHIYGKVWSNLTDNRLLCTGGIGAWGKRVTILWRLKRTGFLQTETNPLHLRDSPRKAITCNPCLSRSISIQHKRENRVAIFNYYINQSTSFRHMSGTSPSGLNQTWRETTQWIMAVKKTLTPHAAQA
jgi:hypothetical protein